MKLTLCAALALATFAQAETAPAIRLNTIGYVPAATKHASLATEAAEFSVVRASDDTVVLKGELKPAIQNLDTGESLRVIDFSRLTEPGEYRLTTDRGDKSAVFHIGNDVFHDAFFLVTRGMYLWRCGTAVDADWHGQHFHHEACHLGDAWLDFVGGGHERQPSIGGWHDAGDYNKYVVNAGVTVGAMLRAWEDFSPAIKKIALKLPEAKGALPEFLAEIKYETDWLHTMQKSDGAVYTKVSTEKFGEFILPEKETTPRYFCPTGTPAAADFSAMLAQASRAFRPYDAAYADRCLAAAKKTYAYLMAHPELQAPDQSHFKTGGYQTKDTDDRLWAAAELWEATEDEAVLKDLETRIRNLGTTFDEDFDWGAVKNLGLITYVFSAHAGRSPELVAEVQQRLLAVAKSIREKSLAHGYERPLGTRYYWGGNGGVARQTILLEAACRVSRDKSFHQVSLNALNYLFGRNVDGRSYVTGLGDHPPMHPHDRRSGADDVVDPWPGYLVGGPNPKANSWRDEQKDFRENEIAINWNAALIYALASALE